MHADARDDTPSGYARFQQKRAARDGPRSEEPRDHDDREALRLQDDLARLQTIVSSVWGLRRDVLAEHTYSRADRGYIEARKALAFLARKYTRASYPYLARAFGRLEHSTVVFAVKQARVLLTESPAFAARVREAERLFEQPAHG